MTTRKEAISRLVRLIEHLYSLGDGRSGSTDWKIHQARTIGFVEACKLLEVLDGAQVQELIDRCHLSAFGETRQQREGRLGSIEHYVEHGDWGIFDTPAYERKK